VLRRADEVVEHVLPQGFSDIIEIKEL
jgi:hypothetical protein